MAITRLLLDTAPAKFPFLAKTVEKNVLFDSKNGDRQSSTPAPSWMENLWPLPDGRNAAIVAGTELVDDLPASIIAKLAVETVTSFTVQSNGAESVLIAGQTFLVSLTTAGWSIHVNESQAFLTSIAILKGDTFILASGLTLYEYKDPDTEPEEFKTIDPVTVTGVDMAEMISICSAVSYLIATDGETIYWSSPLDPKQFVPDVIGDGFGAGATKVLAVKGSINFITTASDGFYIFTDRNIIRSRYTGNAENPWVFTEVRNSSGTFAPKNVVQDSNLGTMFVWSDSGMGAVTENSASYLFPEATEFLSGSIYENYNPVTKEVDAEFNAVIDTTIYFLAGRYLVISYGKDLQEREYILMFDTLVKRWGRIKIPHVTVLDFRDPRFEGKTFDAWTEFFDDSEFTFESMFPSDASARVNAMSFAVINAAGVLTRLTPVDIFTAAIGGQVGVFSVLDNTILYGGLVLTRNRDIEINALKLFYTYPSYPDTTLPVGETNSNLLFERPETSVVCYSEEDPTLRTYLKVPETAQKNHDTYVERVRGHSATIAIENVNSLQAMEASLIAMGTAS